MAANLPRIPWTPAEDAELKRVVALHGDKRWSQISTYLPGRTSKACSHRWRTYLQPGVMHASSVPFSAWEQAVVKEAHRRVGNSWSVIARMLPGRTNAAVKNFWYAYKRRVSKAQGRRLLDAAAPTAAAAAGPDSSGGNGTAAAAGGGVERAALLSDSECEEEEGEEDDLESDGDDDMMLDCNYDDDCEHDFCEDEDMAVGDGADSCGHMHMHGQEGADYSLAWQTAAAAAAGGGGHNLGPGDASVEAAAHAAWLQHHHQQQQQHEEACAAAAGPGGAAAAAYIATEVHATQLDHNPWALTAEHGQEGDARFIGSSGGGIESSSMQPPANDPQQAFFNHHQHQQQQAMPVLPGQQLQHYYSHHQQQQQQQVCMPRRSTHHSWSGAPRSLPGAATTTTAAGPGAGGVMANGQQMQGNSNADRFGATAAWAEPAYAQFGSVAAGGGGASAAAAADEFAPPGPPAGVGGFAAGRVRGARPSEHGCLDPQSQLAAARTSSRHVQSSTQLFDMQAAQAMMNHNTGTERDPRQITTTATAGKPESALNHHQQQQHSSRHYRALLDLSAIDESQPLQQQPVPRAAAGAVETAGFEQHNQHSHMAGSSRRSTGGGLSMDCCWTLEEGGPQQQQQQQQQAAAGVMAVLQQGEAAHPQDGMTAVLLQHKKLVRPSLCSDGGTAPNSGSGGAVNLAATKLGGAQELNKRVEQADLRCSSGGTTGSRRFVLDLSDDAVMGA